MFKKNKKQKKETYQFSKEIVEFIKNKIIKKLNIIEPINVDILEKIYIHCLEYDNEISSKLLDTDYIIENKNEFDMYMKAISCIDYAIENCTIDFDDLNKKLGLI